MSSLSRRAQLACADRPTCARHPGPAADGDILRGR